MRSPRTTTPAVLLAFFTFGFATGCGSDPRTPGASSPRALLDKIVAGIDAQDGEHVAACFDPGTSEGAAVAALTRKAFGVLTASNALEQAARAKFGSDYADEHMALPGTALLFEQMRRRLTTGGLKIEGSNARFGPASAQTQMHERNGIWFFSVPPPFAGDATLVKQVHQLFDRFAQHNDRVRQILDGGTDAKAFRKSMVQLAKETKNASVSLLEQIHRTLNERGLLWK